MLSFCSSLNTNIRSKDLMDVENGYYDSSNDKVTIKVEFQFKK